MNPEQNSDNKIISQRWVLIALIAVCVIRLSIKLYGTYLLQSMPFRGYLVTMSNVGIATHFAIGPIFLIYVQSLLGVKKQFSWREVFHFIPFILLILMVPVNDGSFWKLGILRLHYIHITVYFLFGLRTYLIYLDRKKDEQNQFLFLRNTFLIISILFLLYIPILFRYVQVVDGVLISGAAIYVAVMMVRYKGRLKRQIKYQHSTLDSEKSEQLKQEIIRIMLEEQLFLDSKLTLKRLCEKLEINVNYLSQCINVEFGQSFNDYINSLRIETVKQKLLDPANDAYKISYLAYSSGFESISSFNTAFKKFTGMTPKEFRKSNGDSS